MFLFPTTSKEPKQLSVLSFFYVDSLYFSIGLTIDILCLFVCVCMYVCVSLCVSVFVCVEEL